MGVWKFGNLEIFSKGGLKEVQCCGDACCCVVGELFMFFFIREDNDVVNEVVMPDFKLEKG